MGRLDLSPIFSARRAPSCRSLRNWFGAVSGCLVLAGCAASLPTADQQSPQTSALQSPALAGTLSDAPEHSGKPPALYSRIARRAHSCWLAVDRPLYRTHEFHAEVAPASKAAGATIVIYQRGPRANPRHRLAAMRILITPVSNSHSKVAVINRRFPDAAAKLMTGKIHDWSDNKPGCLAAGRLEAALHQAPSIGARAGPASILKRP